MSRLVSRLVSRLRRANPWHTLVVLLTLLTAANLYGWVTTVSQIADSQRVIESNQQFSICKLIETKQNVEAYVVAEGGPPAEEAAARELRSDFARGKRQLRERLSGPCEIRKDVDDRPR